MTKWRIFKPNKKDFKSESDYSNYRNTARCGICHKMLGIGDEFDLRPIQTVERRKGSWNSIAVIVHRKCVEDNTNMCQKSTN